MSNLEDGPEDGLAPLPVIFGLAGMAPTKDEIAFFKDANPLGYILFARNCESPAQVAALTAQLKDMAGRDAPILIDQEGGRVQRLKPPHFKSLPAAATCGADKGDLAGAEEKARSAARAIANDLVPAGISVNCAPVLDISYPETHDSIGDRAYSDDPQTVARLGTAACLEYLAAGIIPVIKHIPGQGRAAHDSHHDLPVIAATAEEMEKTDFLPYREIMTKAESEAIWGMVAHIVYTAFDSRAPSSCSRRVIFDIVRGKLGFGGFLLSDDICMQALSRYGGAEFRADLALRAGCDAVLHCNGDLAEMQAVAARIPAMTPGAVRRFNRSAAWLRRNRK